MVAQDLLSRAKPVVKRHLGNNAVAGAHMLQPGSKVDDRYEILSLLGRGGFGAVYKARQLQFDRLVAVKILDTDLEYGDGLARFEREAKAIDALRHKNIVSLYGYGSWRRAPYMVMELLQGTPLDQLVLGEGALPPLRAFNIMKQVFEALDSAHKSGVVHRDLKPGNIMIIDAGSENETVKIIDFGLAKLMPGYGVPGQKLTETGYAIGTAYYMAPEQALGGQTDARADIYAAGCIFYELLAGHRPFAAVETVEVMYQHLNDTPPPLIDVLPNDPLCKRMVSVIENCMVKEPEERYQTCSEVLADLVGGQGTLTTTAPRAVPSAKLPTLGPRVPNKLVLVAVSSIVAAAIAGMLFLNQPKQTTEEPDNQAQESEQTSRDMVREMNVSRNTSLSLKDVDALKTMLDKHRHDNLLGDPDRFAIYVQLANIHAFHRDYEPKSPEEQRQLVDEGHGELVRAMNIWQDVQTRVKNQSSDWILARYADLLNNYGLQDKANEVYAFILTWPKLSAPVEVDVRTKYAMNLTMANRKADALKCAEPIMARMADSGVTPMFSRGTTLCIVADVFAMNDKFAKAQEIYRQGLVNTAAGNLNYPQLCTGFAYALMRQGDIEAAFEQAARGIQKSKSTLKNFPAQMLAAACAARLHDDAETKRLLNEVITTPATFRSDEWAQRGAMHVQYALAELKANGYTPKVSEVEKCYPMGH